MCLAEADAAVVATKGGMASEVESTLSVGTIARMPRADAGIYHEYVEVSGGTDSEALILAPNTVIPVSPAAPNLLVDRAQLFGGGL